MIELKLIKEFPHQIIAVDEVGRGPLVGPVVIGAIELRVNSKQELNSLLKCLKTYGITDSKKLTSVHRLSILNDLRMKLLPFRNEGYIKINNQGMSYLTWEMDHQVIDEENILAASLRGMKEATLTLSKKKSHLTTVLIDGNKKFRWGNETSPFHEISLIKGDQISLLIGLASIVAKEKRDQYMREMHELYPQYGFNSHFGYPTSFHREAIKKYGPTPIHRKTFKGVREFL